MLEPAKYGIQDDIRRWREVGMLEQIHCMRSENPPTDNILQGGFGEHFHLQVMSLEGESWQQ